MLGNCKISPQMQGLMDGRQGTSYLADPLSINIRFNNAGNDEVTSGLMLWEMTEMFMVELWVHQRNPCRRDGSAVPQDKKWRAGCPASGNREPHRTVNAAAEGRYNRNLPKVHVELGKTGLQIRGALHLSDKDQDSKRCVNKVAEGWEKLSVVAPWEE